MICTTIVAEYETTQASCSINMFSIRSYLARYCLKHKCTVQNWSNGEIAVVATKGYPRCTWQWSPIFLTSKTATLSVLVGSKDLVGGVEWSYLYQDLCNARCNDVSSCIHMYIRIQYYLAQSCIVILCGGWTLIPLWFTIHAHIGVHSWSCMCLYTVHIPYCSK